MCVKQSTKYQEALSKDPSLTNMRTAKDAQSLLASMNRAEISGGTERQAAWLTAGNLKFREAWHDSIMQLGLSLEQYAALRNFKRQTNQAFHQTSPPSEALMELKKVAVPAEYSQYKEPLIKLLEILSAAPGTSTAAGTAFHDRVWLGGKAALGGPGSC